MIKGNKIFILALCSFFVLNAEQAQAGWPKFDVGLPGKFVESVSRFSEKISENYKNIERVVHEKILGFADKELGPLKKTVSGGKKMVDDVKDKADDAKDKFDDAKDKAEEKLEPLKDKIDEGKDYVDKVKDKVEQAENASGVDKEKAAELAKLQLEKGKISQEYRDKIDASNQGFDSSIKVLDDNMSAYNKELASAGISEDKKLSLNNQLADIGEQKSAKVTEKAIAEKELQDEQNVKLKEIDAKLKSLGKEMANKGYYGLMDKAKSLESFQKKAFLAEGEPETSENVAKITRTRRSQAYDELVNSINVSLRVIASVDDGNKAAKEYKDGVDIAEGENTSIAMDTSIKIEEIKALMRYLEIAVAESKFKTSVALAKIDEYTISDESRDITKFNFDDYNYKKQCNTGGSK